MLVIWPDVDESEAELTIAKSGSVLNYQRMLCLSTPKVYPPSRSWLSSVYKEWLGFSSLVLVLIRQLFRSLYRPGDGLTKALEIVFEGYKTAQTRQSMYEL